jgi:ATPase subunit of ABC transporter with duplicated ATPase domains
VGAQNAKGGRSKGKARLARIEELQSVDYQKRNETNEIFIPPGERLGNKVIEFKNVTKASATAADRQPQLQRAARRASSASSAPTAPASRPCSG